MLPFDRKNNKKWLFRVALTALRPILKILKIGKAIFQNLEIGKLEIVQMNGPKVKIMKKFTESNSVTIPEQTAIGGQYLKPDTTRLWLQMLQLPSYAHI